MINDECWNDESRGKHHSSSFNLKYFIEISLSYPIELIITQNIDLQFFTAISNY